MREIKFRVWDYELHMWVNNIGMGKDNTISKGTEKRLKVIQFTGLKDTNGKEIFESDICQRKETIGDGYKNLKTVISRCKIVYNEDRFALEWITESFYNDSLRSHVNDLEVIGNIYENPELLT